MFIDLKKIKNRKTVNKHIHPWNRNFNVTLAGLVNLFLF